MKAARHGQHEVVSRALETSCSQPQLDVIDEKGRTALMIAALNGHAKVVDVLIGAGADLAVRDVEGKTAADLACVDDIRKAIWDGESRYNQLLQSIMAGSTIPSSSHDLSFGSLTLAASRSSVNL